MSNWTDALTLGTSNASAGDDELRSLMTQFASGISLSFNWPGSGGGTAASGGESKLGNARAAHSDNTVTAYGVGFLSLNTRHPALVHIGPVNHLLGHSSMIDHGVGAALPPATRWVTQAGTSTLTSGISFGTATVSFTTPFATTPFVLVDIFPNAATNSPYLVNLSTVTVGGFSASFSGLGNTLGILPVLVWESNGSMSF